MSLSSGAAHADDYWQSISLAEAGFSADLGKRLDVAARNGELNNLHAVLVVRHGRLAFERYYEGPDERWFRSLGTIKFAPDVKHDIRSITKSVVGLLYGIALSEGKVPAVDQSLVDQFAKSLPGDAIIPPCTAADPDRRRITIAHALSMSLGTEWDETSVPQSDSRNSLFQMATARDRYRFVLDRPMVAEPGTRWAYNTGATIVLGHLIAHGTGKPLETYVRDKLFDPMGIADAEWVAGPDGVAAAGGGLRMCPRDVAKLGQLILNRGRWRGKQLVPAAWLDESFTPHARAMDALEYGYQWWLGQSARSGRRWIGGFGQGGQRLFAIPDLELVTVIMAGNYDATDSWKVPVAVGRVVGSAMTRP